MPNRITDITDVEYTTYAEYTDCADNTDDVPSSSMGAGLCTEQQWKWLTEDLEEAKEIFPCQ